MTNSSNLYQIWGNSLLERLQSAQNLNPQDLDEITKSLLADGPLNRWPYGCHTSINPWITFLGPSPGNSPAAGDSTYVTRDSSRYPPTAGTPANGMLYCDPRGFFDRLRSLTYALIDAEAGQEVPKLDALALAGIMNLDTGASGEANNVKIDPDFARWSIDVSIHRLRPRYVIGLGLVGVLRKSEWLCKALEGYTGESFDPNRPPISKLFEGYDRTRYWFRAWPLLKNGSTPQHFILFPQHLVELP